MKTRLQTSSARTITSSVAASLLKQRRSQRYIAKIDQEKATKRAERKRRFVDNAYHNGGEAALAAIKKYGRTETGEPIRWDAVLEEQVLLVCDMRIGDCVFTGNAQGGKTLSHTLAFTYFVSEGQLNCAWIYDTATNLNANMPVQFQRIAESWIRFRYQEAGLDVNKTKNASRNQNRRRFMIGNGMAVLTYASTSAKADDGKAAIGSVGASFQSSINFEEERSQWPNGVDMDARLGASVFPTKPRRSLGTPGSGSGIEKEVAVCSRHFYPHTICPHCSKRTVLDPKGALLKQFTRSAANGEVITTYFSVSGRPQGATQDTQGNITPAQWYHHDPEDAVNTAYVACVHCQGEIDMDTRTRKAFMACIKTDITAREFIHSLPPGVPRRRLKVAQQISPLIRYRDNVAIDIIDKGLNPNTNPADWQQQVLGHPSEISKTGLTREIIAQSVATPKRKTEFDLVLAGLDQGHAQHWLWIAGINFPTGWEKLSIDEVIERSTQTVLFAEPIAQNQLRDLLTSFEVDYGILDNEPSRDWAEEACTDSPMEMADQVTGLKQPAILSTVESGSIVHQCWRIRNERFLQSVVDGFFTAHTDGYPLIRLPPAWATYTDPGASRKHNYSPVVQLIGPSFDIATNTWRRGPGNNDDLFYACMFQQAALYLWLKYKSGDNAPISPTVIRPNTPKAGIPSKFFNSVKRKNIRF